MKRTIGTLAGVAIIVGLGACSDSGLSVSEPEAQTLEIPAGAELRVTPASSVEVPSIYYQGQPVSGAVAEALQARIDAGEEYELEFVRNDDADNTLPSKYMKLVFASDSTSTELGG